MKANLMRGKLKGCFQNKWDNIYNSGSYNVTLGQKHLHGNSTKVKKQERAKYLPVKEHKKALISLRFKIFIRLLHLTKKKPIRPHHSVVWICWVRQRSTSRLTLNKPHLTSDACHLSSQPSLTTETTDCINILHKKPSNISWMKYTNVFYRNLCETGCIWTERNLNSRLFHPHPRPPPPPPTTTPTPFLLSPPNHCNTWNLKYHVFGL